MNYNKQEYMFILGKGKKEDGKNEQVVNWVNNKLKTLKNVKLETTVSIVIYDDTPVFYAERENVKNVVELTPEDLEAETENFAFYDAVCETMGLVGEHLNELPEEEKPCLVFLYTEWGAHDTCSVDNTVSDFNWQIGVQRGKYFWNFDKI